MLRPERRTRGDLIAAAAIATVVLLFLSFFWWRSSTRATVLRPAQTPAPPVVAAKAVPDALTQTWRADSSRTRAPLILNGTVVTGDGRTMAGLDSQTGTQRWSYARDRELCAVSYVYDIAVAVYPDRRGCGQVTGIKAGTGERGPTRSSYADKQVIVRSDGNAVLSYGPTRLELWRSDLVRSLSYGEIDARIKPVNTGLGEGCALMSAAASDVAAAVLESCKDSNDLRLTLLKPAKEEDEPDIKRVALPGIAADSDARVLAVIGTSTAVYLPTPRPAVVVYDDTGTKVSETPLTTAAALGGGVPVTTRAGELLTWWTGSAVMVFDDKLTHLYTIEAGGPRAPIGPATVMAGMLLVPLDDGLAVCNKADGAFQRLIPLTHPSGTGAVVPAVAGPTVIEQRGPMLAGFGPA